MSEEPSAMSGAGAAGARSGGAWGSTLSCQELAAIGSVGFAPVGQVFGAAVYGAGSASGSDCPGVRGDSEAFVPLVEAMYQARRTAIDRMAAECAALGGHGVIGVRLSRASFPLGGLDFTAIGTAVQAVGTAATAGPRVPFTSDLCGQDFAKLIMAGSVPAGLALGIAVGGRHDDWATVRQARVWAGNAEMAGWTELVIATRQEARRGLDGDVRRLGADGVVITDMRMRVRVRDCPVATGRRDHVVEVTIVGTAIAGFAPAGHRHPGPALAIMPVGPRRG